MLALTGILSIPSAAMAQPSGPPYGMMMGPGMWQNLTPEQREQMWQNMQRMREYMLQQGYGPGMMGPGMWQYITPEQREQMWQNMQRMREYMLQQGYGPGMMMAPPGRWEPPTPAEYQKWWDETHAAHKGNAKKNTKKGK
jgi:hypothetical protein